MIGGMADKYSAVWLSYSSISDYLKCPRLYYLNNMYRNPNTGNKVSIINPYLALGQIVHEVLESLSQIPTEERFSRSLIETYNGLWPKISGNKGGFEDEREENRIKERGAQMLRMVMNQPGPIAKKAVKIRQDLPHYWLSEKDEIILCGKIDWLEYLEESDSVHLVDFKTGKRVEMKDSLQLPIYYLVASNTQKRTVTKLSYWYLESKSSLDSVAVPSAEEISKKVLEIGKKIKLSRIMNKFECPEGGCRDCQAHEEIVAGKAMYVGVNDFRQDLFVVKKSATFDQESDIL